MDADLTRPHGADEPREPAEGIPARPGEDNAAGQGDGAAAPGAGMPEVAAPGAGESVVGAPVRGGDAAPSSPPHQVSEPEGGMLVLGGAPLADAPAPASPEAERAHEDICPECDGTFGSEGYCDQCGAARPDERLHYVLDAGHGVAAVCDRGIRHLTNEDAVAVAAEVTPARRFALVVSDGVSTAPRSAQASAAAVAAALAVLTDTSSVEVSEAESALVEVLSRRLAAAAEAADEAVREVGAMPDDTADASGIAKSGQPACTLVAAIVMGDTVVVGNIGDSRAYWIPDGPPEGAAVLTTDDSWANEEIAMGVDPAEAEAGPHAHTITKWLGEETPDVTPRVTGFTLTEPGYLLVCSDGLWNYASPAHQVRAALQQARSTLPPEAGVKDLAGALVDWANVMGGADNVTVALARIDTVGDAAPTERVDREHLDGGAVLVEESATESIPAPEVYARPEG